jgi:hypothetical protein
VIGRYVESDPWNSGVLRRSRTALKMRIRFLRADSLNDMASYPYVKNNPLKHFDRTGLSSLEIGPPPEGTSISVNPKFYECIAQPRRDFDQTLDQVHKELVECLSDCDKIVPCKNPAPEDQILSKMCKLGCYATSLGEAMEAGAIYNWHLFRCANLYRNPSPEE